MIAENEKMIAEKEKLLEEKKKVATEKAHLLKLVKEASITSEDQS